MAMVSNSDKSPTTQHILQQFSQEGSNRIKKQELLNVLIREKDLKMEDGNIIFGGSSHGRSSSDNDDDNNKDNDNNDNDEGEEQYHHDNDNDNDDDDEYYRPSTILAIGKQRFNSDRRQIGGLLLVLSLCATFQPLDNICTLLGTANYNNNNIDIDIGGGGGGGGPGGGNTMNNLLTPIEKSSIAAGMIQICFGLLGMIVGYLSIIHDYGNKNLSASLIILIQLGWMPYLVQLTSIGLDASSPYTESTFRQIDSNGQYLIVGQYIDNPWIPPVYLPTMKDVRFFGAMGILGVLSYGFAFLGSFAFMAFAQYTFDCNQPTQRDARYYRSRLLFYTSILTLAGVSQLLLGSYIIFEFGTGPLVPAMGIAMYIVHYPEISVAVGLLQMLVGYFGMARYIGWAPSKPNDHQFQIFILIQSLAMLVLQYIVQIGYGPNNNAYPSPSSLALLSVGLNILPAFLDYKMRTTPEYLTGEYYGILTSSTKDKDNDSQVRIGNNNNQQPPREIPLGGFQMPDSMDSTSGNNNALLTTATNRGSNNNPEASKNTTSTSTGMEDTESLNIGDNDIEQSAEFGLLGGRPNNNNNKQQGLEPPPPPPPPPQAAAAAAELHSTEESDRLRKSVQWSNTGNSYYSDPTVDKDDDDADDERHREPSARLGSRRIDRNAMTNELYEQLNQSQMTRRKSNRSSDRNSWDTGDDDDDDDTRTFDSPTPQQEPSARLNSRSIDPNEIINQMYDEATGTASYTNEPLNDTVATRSRSSHDDDDDDCTGIASQPSAYSDVRSSNDIDAYSQPSAYSGYSQPSASGHGYSEYNEDASSRDGYSAYSEGMSLPSAAIQSVDSDEYSSDDPSGSSRRRRRRQTTKRDDPPERISQSLSDDELVREMFGNMPHDDPGDEQGITIYKTYEEPNSNDLSDDSSQSTAILEGKLEEIENEIFTDAMQSVHDSLVNIL